jgi:hypothetical protein
MYHATRQRNVRAGVRKATLGQVKPWTRYPLHQVLHSGVGSCVVGTPYRSKRTAADTSETNPSANGGPFLEIPTFAKVVTRQQIGRTVIGGLERLFVVMRTWSYASTIVS